MTTTEPDEAYCRAVERHGFAIVRAVLDKETIDRLLAALAPVGPETGDTPQGRRYAIRNLLEAVPFVRDVAASAPVCQWVEPILGAAAFPVQAIFFDKPPWANWKVPWHQDLTIPVKPQIDIPGFGPWSVKGGVPHVQPPAELLERLLIVRLHLDACTEGNGPLRVIPGSHRHGKLSHVQIQRWREQEEATCLVPQGGALLMRPLLLHASSAAQVPGHRRVIHLEYAADPLPGGLEWAR
jgi:ectoine hydroxylase-related dioxygenase (phytanoyl-CoA dioxygenase family)